MSPTRRDFLQTVAASTAAVAVLAGCQPVPPELQVQSPARIPADATAPYDVRYATLCRLCPAGCGIVVRTIEGRAKKIEGSPLHPVNHGKTSAPGQAGVQ